MASLLRKPENLITLSPIVSTNALMRRRRQSQKEANSPKFHENEQSQMEASEDPSQRKYWLVSPVTAYFLRVVKDELSRPSYPWIQILIVNGILNMKVRWGPWCLFFTSANTSKDARRIWSQTLVPFPWPEYIVCRLSLWLFAIKANSSNAVAYEC
jgi:hypothetical protein